MFGITDFGDTPCAVLNLIKGIIPINIFLNTSVGTLEDTFQLTGYAHQYLRQWQIPCEKFTATHSINGI